MSSDIKSVAANTGTSRKVVRRAFVTGASGFIGRVLCQRLRNDGWEATALLRQPQEGPWGRAAGGVLGEAGGSLPAWSDAVSGADVVFHLAGKAHALAEVHEDEREYRKANTEGTAEVVAACRACGVRRLVYFSSIKVYADEQIRAINARGQPLDEAVAPEPDSPYGQSKLDAERLVLADPGEIEGVALRLCMVYGPSLKGNLQRMIEAVLAGRFPPLPEVNNRRSMVHVEDVVEAALLAATSPQAAGREYLVTDGQPYSTRRIYEWICAAAGKKPPSWTIPLPVLSGLGYAGDLVGRVRGRRFAFDSAALEKLTGSAWFSCDRIKAELGFQPRHGLADTIPVMVSGKPDR
jgi:UDP-glucose 4-epimerase